MTLHELSEIKLDHFVHVLIYTFVGYLTDLGVHNDRDLLRGVDHAAESEI